MKPKTRKGLLAAGTLTAAEAVMVAARRGSLLQVDTVVRCRSGHHFTTWWIPGASVKALRLGWWRVQRCPVGDHWTLVTPVRASRLSEAERQAAAAHHDRRVP